MHNCQEEQLKSLNEKFPKLSTQNQRYIMGIINALSFAEKNFEEDKDQNKTKHTS